MRVEGSGGEGRGGRRGRGGNRRMRGRKGGRGEEGEVNALCEGGKGKGTERKNVRTGGLERYVRVKHSTQYKGTLGLESTSQQDCSRICWSPSCVGAVVDVLPCACILHC